LLEFLNRLAQEVVMKRGLMASSAISVAWLSIRPSALPTSPQQKERGVHLKFKRVIGGLLIGAVLGSSQVLVVPAYADEAQLQRQLDAMQRQMEAMQQELAETKKQLAQPRTVAVRQRASSAPTQVVTARNGNEIIIPPPQSTSVPMPTKSLPAWFDGIHFSMAGSFIELDGAWRQHSEVSNGASDPPFGSPGIPLQNSALWNQREFRLSAQQSRIALKVDGDIDPNQHLKGYYEMDFLGASTDANNRESNSFTPRIRQAYGQYDNDTYHLHAVAGQAWSLATQNRVGMLPGTENNPLTIDAQYVVGFDWLRNPQARVYDWGKIAWFGLSIEQPATVFPGSPSAATVSPPTPIATSINNNCTGSSHLNATTTCSIDVAPDIIEKFAVDPGFGHYEVLGIQRWFGDEVAASNVPNSWSQKVTFGWGAGGSALLPVIPSICKGVSSTAKASAVTLQASCPTQLSARAAR
jgi:gas vesicle protein